MGIRPVHDATVDRRVIPPRVQTNWAAPFPLKLLAEVRGGAREQGAWDAWPVILVGILGIVAVELGGVPGAFRHRARMLGIRCYSSSLPLWSEASWSAWATRR